MDAIDKARANIKAHEAAHSNAAARRLLAEEEKRLEQEAQRAATLQEQTKMAPGKALKATVDDVQKAIVTASSELGRARAAAQSAPARATKAERQLLKIKEQRCKAALDGLRSKLARLV